MPSPYSQLEPSYPRRSPGDHESIRTIIEQVKSTELDQGIVITHLNSRGVTIRHPYEGGKQERSLATKYSSDAESIQLTSPRTAGILRSIAESYDSSADGMDINVEIGN